jgi:hypothetical protein
MGARWGLDDRMRGALGFTVPHIAGGDAFDPLTITNLVGWWDASDTATITASSGAVSQWDNKASTSPARDLIQGTGSAQPTTGTRTQNGLNVLDFDGGDWIYNAGTYAILPATIAVVAATDNPDNNDRRLTGNPNGQGNFIRVSGGVWGSGAWPSISSAVADDTTPRYVVYTQASGSQLLRIDGSQVGSNTFAPPDDITRLGLGARSDGLAPWDGWAAEYIVYDSVLTGTDLSDLETYLADKWGL